MARITALARDYETAMHVAYDAAISCGKLTVADQPTSERRWMSTWWLISSP